MPTVSQQQSAVITVIMSLILLSRRIIMSVCILLPVELHDILTAACTVFLVPKWHTSESMYNVWIL